MDFTQGLRDKSGDAPDGTWSSGIVAVVERHAQQRIPQGRRPTLVIIGSRIQHSR